MANWREHALPWAVEVNENKTRQKAKSNLKYLCWPNKTQLRVGRTWPRLPAAPCWPPAGGAGTTLAGRVRVRTHTGHSSRLLSALSTFPREALLLVMPLLENSPWLPVSLPLWSPISASSALPSSTHVLDWTVPCLSVPWQPHSPF